MKRPVSVALLVAVVAMAVSAAVADDRVKIKSEYYTPYGKVKEYRYPYQYYPYYAPPCGYYSPPTCYYNPYNPAYPPPAYYPPCPYYGGYKVKTED